MEILWDAYLVKMRENTRVNVLTAGTWNPKR